MYQRQYGPPNNSGSTQGKGSTSELNKSTTPNLSSKTWERQKANSTGMSVLSLQQTLPFLWHCWTRCPRTVQNPAQLPPNLEHPSLIRTNPCLLAWIQKKTEQSLKTPHDPRMHWTPSCKNSYSHASTLSNPDSLTFSLTSDTLPDMVLKSLVDFRDLPTLSWFCVCSDSASSSIWHSTYQTLTHQWNFQFYHLIGARLSNQFSYQGNHRTWLFTSLCWTRVCMIVLDTTGSPATIPQLTGYWAASFSGNHRSTNPRAHPLLRHPFRNFQTLSRIFRNPFCQ